ncbi:hypothetical protein N431DRAFT_156194 [Stipitochalara longipes BDJ]|nr:hypothetical protein N431DRAFT_156194 [Stipitochalara longipes BDJ]
MRMSGTSFTPAPGSSRSNRPISFLMGIFGGQGRAFALLTGWKNKLQLVEAPAHHNLTAAQTRGPGRYKFQFRLQSARALHAASPQRSKLSLLPAARQMPGPTASRVAVAAPTSGSGRRRQLLFPQLPLEPSPVPYFGCVDYSGKASCPALPALRALSPGHHWLFTQRPRRWLPFVLSSPSTTGCVPLFVPEVPPHLSQLGR